MIIREAESYDFIDIMALGREMHKESPRFKSFEMNEEKCLALFNQIQADGGAFIAEENKTIIGMFVGMVHEHYFSKELTASDLALYVSPEHRGGSAAVRLIQRFERWAKEKGAKCMTLSSNTLVDPEKTLAMFCKMGFEYCGGVTYKEF